MTGHPLPDPTSPPALHLTPRRPGRAALPKMLAAIAGLAVIGSAVLGVRRIQLESRHAAGQLHADIDGYRQATWELQTRIQTHVRPSRLNAELQSLPARFEPLDTAAP